MRNRKEPQKATWPRAGGGQDTHEVMAISTNMRERGIQRPKQQNTDTTCFHRSKKLVRARRETLFCALSKLL